MNNHLRDKNTKDVQSFEAWQKVCDGILTEPFPPETSEFPRGTLERDARLTFSKPSNWEIVCQQILDTKYSHIYYQKCYKELLRRGKTVQDIFEMRRFAWYTASWLNFAMMLWDWVSLDESDMLRAIAWLYEKKQNSHEKRLEFENFLELHES